MRYQRRWLSGAFATALILVVCTGRGQGSGPTLEWRTYGGDLRSTRYSEASQIDATNFAALQVAWRFKTDNLGPRPEFNLQSTPLMVKGRLYSTGGTRRSVVALDAATGELKWVYGVDEGKRADMAPRKLSGRGLAYWTDGRDERILYVTAGYALVALDARTGRPVPAFGQDGMIDLRNDDDQDIDPVTGDIGLHAAPIVVKDVIVVGAAHSAGIAPKSRVNVKGYVRGYDVRTGRRLWIFHTVPTAGEFGGDTWLEDSASYTGNTGAWAQMSADEQLGYVYVPTEMPTNDGYGGHRPGANLFADSVVALDVNTGKRVWHFQMIHHDMWDFDLPCAPILADLTVDGRPVRALAQPSKQGFLYVLDRTNGRPVWPIEERPVPKGDVPREWYSPTQPMPTKPPAFDRQGVSVDDLIDFTPELRAEATQLVARYKMGPLFTPPVASDPSGFRATLLLPHTLGGANWPGGSFDPETNRLYIYSGTDIGAMGLVHDPARSDMNFIQGLAPERNQAGQPAASAAEGGPSLRIRGLPLVKPPYGRITAFDLNRGDILWQIAHGETDDSVRNHPALKDLIIPRTGRFGRVGTLVTKTLLIAGDPGVSTASSGKRGAMLRAYDKATGREVGAVFMPAPQTGSPMTYVLDGRQYIVVAVSGGGYSGELLAFRLSE
jgi:quinoprotein glucose dehydrogenase